MIYLVTVHDPLKRVANIDSPLQLKTTVWKSILKLTLHKTVLYPIKTFIAFNNKALPNRVNIVFAQGGKRTNKLPNVLVNNNFKEIVQTFKGADDDLYVIGSTTELVELFAKDSDFIVDYTTKELGHTQISIFDTINFADYTLLKKEEHEKFVTRYFIREHTNFIGF